MLGPLGLTRSRLCRPCSRSLSSSRRLSPGRSQGDGERVGPCRRRTSAWPRSGSSARSPGRRSRRRQLDDPETSWPIVVLNPQLSLKQLVGRGQLLCSRQTSFAWFDDASLLLLGVAVGQSRFAGTGAGGGGGVIAGGCGECGGLEAFRLRGGRSGGCGASGGCGSRRLTAILSARRRGLVAGSGRSCG